MRMSVVTFSITALPETARRPSAGGHVVLIAHRTLLSDVEPAAEALKTTDRENVLQGGRRQTQQGCPIPFT